MSTTTATGTTPVKPTKEAKPGKAGKAAKGDGDAPKKGGKKKLLMLVVLVLVVGGAAAWWFLFRSSGSAKASAPPPPVAGTVLTADPISINLADGHYLKIGIALQEVKGAKDVTDPSRALDATISLYSGQTMATLSDPTSRDKIKAQLVKKVAKDYDDEVFDVYFTSYVMQ